MGVSTLTLIEGTISLMSKQRKSAFMILSFEMSTINWEYLDTRQNIAQPSAGSPVRI